MTPLQRIYPDHRSITAEDATGELRLEDSAPPERPYLVLNMVMSADGAAAIAGRTKELGSEHDRALFHGLRASVDAVMVGASTVAVEGYGRLVRDPARRELRAARGLAPEPIACVVSGHLSVPADVPLLQDPDSHVVVLTRMPEGDLGPAAARVEYLREPPGSAELGPFLLRLRSEYGIRSILCEGGPKLNAQLLAEGLVDELFLTLSPKLAGGSPAITIVAGSLLPEPAELDLVSVLEGDGHLFLRFALRR